MVKCICHFQLNYKSLFFFFFFKSKASPKRPSIIIISLWCILEPKCYVAQNRICVFHQKKKKKIEYVSINVVPIRSILRVTWWPLILVIGLRWREFDSNSMNKCEQTEDCFVENFWSWLNFRRKTIIVELNCIFVKLIWRTRNRWV